MSANHMYVYRASYRLIDSDEEVILQPNGRLFYRQTEFFYLYDDCNKICMYCHNYSLSLLMHIR